MQIWDIGAELSLLRLNIGVFSSEESGQIPSGGPVHPLDQKEAMGAVG